jgi:hypothetical protein
MGCDLSLYWRLCQLQSPVVARFPGVIKSADDLIDLFAPARFGLSASPIYFARFPAVPLAVANLESQIRRGVDGILGVVPEFEGRLGCFEPCDATSSAIGCARHRSHRYG